MPHDAEGHFLYELGQNLSPRCLCVDVCLSSSNFYLTDKIMKGFGEGTFGKVVQCWDRQTHSYVAIKVVRAVSKYSEAAKIEIEILEDILRHDPDRRRSAHE